VSDLAAKIAETSPVSNPVRRGPIGACSIYPPGDLDDWNAVEALRASHLSWREVQTHIDDLLGVDRPIHLEKFRYHWRRRCACWPDHLRLS
jgi:hypothetical protein